MIEVLRDGTILKNGKRVAVWYRGSTVRYAAVTINRKKYSVHRLVCEKYHGPPKPGQEVRHLNGDPLDNRAENLRWGTHSENMRDAVVHGTLPDKKGEENPNAKLTEDDIREIRRLRGIRLQREIAELFRITTATVRNIQLRRHWAHVA